MPKTKDPLTARAEAIASQVTDLKLTELVIITVPEDTRTEERDRFAKDFAAILREKSSIDPTRVAIVVLTTGMTLEDLDDDQLAKAKLIRVEPEARQLLVEMADRDCEVGWSKGDCRNNKSEETPEDCWPCKAKAALGRPLKDHSPF